MNNISIEYKISLQEFMEAYECHWKSHKMGTLSNVISSLVIMALGIIISFESLYLGVSVVAIGLILTIIIALRYALHRMAFHNTPKYMSESKVDFTDGKIHSENAAGMADLNWSIYNNYLVSPKYILLYMSKNSFSIIPNSAFQTKDELERFKLILNSKLKK